ncbi:flagellar hook assembly protein FlgD [Bacillaceae bacterium Marseille-Q3522]|nr:flagellar hook assembly protein FlgD [Bacillaceae bacterium Marseille-Q3522]
MTNSIDSSYLYTSYLDRAKNTGSDSLGKDDFLKILMAQLQNQDPLNPMEDRDFVSQLATFSSLEQLMNMGTSFEQFAQGQTENQLVSYSQFVGKEVTWHKLELDQDNNPVTIEGNGRVASIQYKDNMVQFILEDGTVLEPGNISQVNNDVNPVMIQNASMMIGKTITYLNEEKEEVSAKVASVSIKDGQISLQLDDEQGTNIQLTQIIKIE